jgi:uncharacterized protein
MELLSEFEVPVGPDDAFAILTDLAQVAPCLPGATLTAVEGDDHHGSVTVRLGPIQVAYEGTARLVELDASRRRGRIEASGREVRGSGSARADVHAEVNGDGDGSRVRVRTVLDITGRPAQFGSGVLEEVGRNIIDAFAIRLRERLVSGEPNALDGVARGSALSTATGTSPSTGNDSLDLVRVAGPAVAKRLVPLAALAVLVWLVVRRRRGSRRQP